MSIRNVIGPILATALASGPAVGAPAAPVAPAAASTSAPAFTAAGLVDWGPADAVGLVGSLSGTIVASGDSASGQPVVLAEVQGIRFLMVGAACQGQAQARRCAGLDISTAFTLPSEAALNETLRTLGYGAVALRPGAGNTMTVGRYVVLTGGVTPNNLIANLDILLSATAEISQKLNLRTDTLSVTPGTPPGPAGSPPVPRTPRAPGALINTAPPAPGAPISTAPRN